MNATWLHSLYPRSWRNRHEAVRSQLEERPATFMDVVDVGIGALDAHLREAEDVQAALDRPTPGLAGTQPSATWMSFLFGHVALFITVNVVLAAINLLTDRSTL